LFIRSSELDDNDDEKWQATFGEQSTSPEHDREQQLHLQKSELERFTSESLDTFTTAVIDGKITKVSMVDEQLRWQRERG
jgi:hypothetical protein